MNKDIILLIFSLLTFSIFFGCQESTTRKIKVVKNIIDIGKINKNDISIATFKIVNLDNRDLVIDNILTDCHCTLPDWSRKTIYKKGDTASIKVQYDNHMVGFFEQTASVYIKNSSEVPLLIMRGTVVD